MAKEVEEKIGADVNAAKLKALQATIDKIEKEIDKRKEVMKEILGR